MPIDRNKILRYKILNECFRDMSRQYRIGDLLDCVNRELKRYDLNTVSRRTVQKDLQDLQMEPHNVEFDEVLRESNCYRYADTSFSLEVLQLTPKDRDALARTIEVLLERYSDPDEQNPQWQWMLTTLQSIADNRPLESAEPYVSFENNEAYSGNVNFATLLESIINRHPVVIRYKPFVQKEAEEYKAHPYYLKQYNSRWFLFAEVEGQEGIWNFALDRILSVRQWKHAYRLPQVDFNDYFSDMIGVSRTADMHVEPITLKVSNSRYPYVETKPFSEKQRIKTHDGQTHTVTFPMRVNNELVQKLLSFGDDIEVLQPQHLRQRMAAIVEAMKEKYSPAQKDCVGK